MVLLEKESICLKLKFCLGNISEKSDVNKSGEVLFKGNLYDFLVDYNDINKSDMLNIRKFLTVKSNTK